METKLAEAFDKCDTNKSGFLEPNEINHVLENWNSLIPNKKAPKELELCAKDFLGRVDLNKDGKVSKKEFVDYFRSKFAN